MLNQLINVGFTEVYSQGINLFLHGCIYFFFDGGINRMEDVQLYFQDLNNRCIQSSNYDCNSFSVEYFNLGFQL